MRPVRVAVVDEHEIFRRGVVTCLAEDPTIVVVADVAGGPARRGDAIDVVVASPAAAAANPGAPARGVRRAGGNEGRRQRTSS